MIKYRVHAQNAYKYDWEDYYYTIEAKNEKQLHKIFKKNHPDEMIIEFFEVD